MKVFRLAGAVAVVHGLEDIGLLSLGRFLPVPIWAMYLIGLFISTVLLTFVVDKLIMKRLDGSRSERANRTDSD
jgi:membrane associated rhomboid family serine protease